MCIMFIVNESQFVAVCIVPVFKLNAGILVDFYGFFFFVVIISVAYCYYCPTIMQLVCPLFRGLAFLSISPCVFLPSHSGCNCLL